MKNSIPILLLLFLSGCTVVEVVDVWKNLDKYTWQKNKPVKIPVEIKDTGYYYNLSVNLRVTNDYKYSNIWLNLHTIYPNGKKTTEPVMLTLADHKGVWAGHNLGHVISFQLPVIKDKVYNTSGKYIFELEQFMRDTTLNEVVSVGIKLDKQQEILK